jgi:hypothetical protein
MMLESLTLTPKEARHNTGPGVPWALYQDDPQRHQELSGPCPRHFFEQGSELLFTFRQDPFDSQAHMQGVYRLLREARERGLIPLEWIVDETCELGSR